MTRTKLKDRVLPYYTKGEEIFNMTPHIVGGAFGILIMSAFGYVANAQQTAQALKGINFTVNLLPAILFFLAAAMCLLWKMTDKEAEDIRAQLREKHTA